MPQPTDRYAPAEIVRLNFDGWAIALSNDYRLVNLTHLCGLFQKRPAEFFALADARIVTMCLLSALTDADEPFVDATFTAEGREGGEWAHRILALECARWLDTRLFVALAHFITRGLDRRAICAALPLPSLAPHPAIQRLVEHLASCEPREWKPRELMEIGRLLGVLGESAKGSSAVIRSRLGKMFAGAAGTIFAAHGRRFAWEMRGKGNQRLYLLRCLDA